MSLVLFKDFGEEETYTETNIMSGMGVENVRAWISGSTRCTVSGGRILFMAAEVISRKIFVVNTLSR